MILSDPTTTLVTGAVAALALIAVSLIALRAWREWVALKREELAIHSGRTPSGDSGSLYAGSRIELADLRERLKKLEAIAAGVDL